MGLAQKLDKLLSEAVHSDIIRELGLGDQTENHTFEDLKYVRGPVSDNPIDVRPWIITYEGEKRRFMLKNEAIEFAQSHPGSKIEHKPEGEPVARWQPMEVMSALAPVIIRIGKKFSKDAWTARHGGGFSRQAFEDLVQSQLQTVWSAIVRGDDEARLGNSFVTWIRARMHAAAGSGIGAGREYRNSVGYLNSLSSAKVPQEVETQIAKIPESYRSEGAGLTVGKENPYGKFSPQLYRLSVELRDALQAANADVVRSVKDKVAALKDNIRDDMSVKILGARTGVHDVVSFPHSGSKLDRYLNKLLNAKTADEVSVLASQTPRQKTYGDSEGVQKKVDARRLTTNLHNALTSGDPHKIDVAHSEIESILTDMGSRERWRKQHRQLGLEIPGAEGETMYRTDLGPVKGDYLRSLAKEDSSVLGEIIDAAIDGQKTDAGVVQLTPLEHRIVIRLYGLYDYPSRGTSSDVEFDPDTFKNIESHLKNGQPLTITPVDDREAEVIINAVGKSEESKKQLLQDYHTNGSLTVQTTDKDTVEELASILAYSSWVRMGCPALTGPQTATELEITHKGNLVSDVTMSKNRKKIIDKLKKVANFMVSRGHIKMDESIDPILTALFKLQDCATAYGNTIMENLDIIDADVVTRVQRSIRLALLEMAFTGTI